MHSEYVILIAFPLQQWLNERASVLRYTYIACHINLSIQMFNFPVIGSDVMEWTTYGILEKKIGYIFKIHVNDYLILI